MSAELCMNPTSSEELRDLSMEVYDLSRSPVEDEELESRVRMACNAMMCGDGGPAFTWSHSAALAFIAQLLELRADELDRLRPSYWRAGDDPCHGPDDTTCPSCRLGAASVDTLPKGQDAKQGLAGTEGSAVPKADAHNTSPIRE